MRIYRASELGGCIKAQVAKHLDFTAVDTSKHMENLGREGNLHEEEIIRRINEQSDPITNRKVEDQQLEVNLEILPGVVVQGHVDGLLHGVYQAYEVLEIKSMGDDPYKAWMKTGWDTPGLVQKYKWQVSVYMVALDLPMWFVVKNRNNGQVNATKLDAPFYSREQIMSRVLEIERYVRLGELPDDCSVQQFPCPWFYLHDQTSIELMEDDTIDALAGEYDAARLAAKVAEQRKSTAQTALSTALGSRNRVDTATATVAKVTGARTTLDRDRLQKTLENMEDSLTAYESKKPYEYVRVKIREAGDEIL